MSVYGREGFKGHGQEPNRGRGGGRIIGTECVATERRLAEHISGRSEYLSLCVVWAAFKGRMVKAKIGERAAGPEAWHFLSGTDFKVKDRY